MDVAAAATRVLMQVLEEKLPLTQALIQQRERLSDPQRLPLLQELCYGTLRFMPRLEAIMELLLARPLPRLNREVACLLATGLYRLEHMNIPDHAAVNLTVEGCSGAAQTLGTQPDQMPHCDAICGNASALNNNCVTRRSPGMRIPPG